MKIGDEVRIKKTNKQGDLWRNIELYRKGTIVNIFPTFILVQCENGYKECFSEKELILVEKRKESE